MSTSTVKAQTKDKKERKEREQRNVRLRLIILIADTYKGSLAEEINSGNIEIFSSVKDEKDCDIKDEKLQVLESCVRYIGGQIDEKVKEYCKKYNKVYISVYLISVSHSYYNIPLFREEVKSECMKSLLKQKSNFKYKNKLDRNKSYLFAMQLQEAVNQL